MAERLFGVETEYALSALAADGSVIDRGPLLQRVIEKAAQRIACLPDPSGRGVFLRNGARFYIDAPDHPEFTTPECTNPWDVVRYIRAGERILYELATACSGERGCASVFITRCNVDYCGTGSTWGTHESYLHRTPMKRLLDHILPHLVSRIIFTGAGGFNSRFVRGIQFTLSPRVWHLECDASDQSTQSRGIFHTKDESLSRHGNKRLHIISGESVCSERASWLKIATTALVVALADAGHFIADSVYLQSPLTAMQGFANDPTCRLTARTQKGGDASALDIQRTYLALAEKHVGADFMPAWAAEACRQWRSILDALQQAPGSVATTLDWAIKLALYQNRARQRAIPWLSLPHWNHVAAKLGEALKKSTYPDKRPPVAVILDPNGPIGDEVQRQEIYLRRHGLEWSGFVPFLELRQELFEIDARFGALGGQGIFDTLDRAGVLTHQAPGVDNIEQAMNHPPMIGRAAVRGRLIGALSRESSRYICDWASILDCVDEKVIDLSDPFATTAEWRPRSWLHERGLDDLESLIVTSAMPVLPRRRRRA